MKPRHNERTSVKHSPAVDLVPVAPGEYQRLLECGQVQAVHVTKTIYWQMTPVLVGLYRSYLDAAVRTTDAVLEVWDGQWRQGPLFSEANSLGDDLPVVGASHDDALGFTGWLAQRDGRPYRLPTEVEFELAARASCSCGTTCRIGPEHAYEPGRWPGAFVSRWRISGHLANQHGIRGMNCMLWQWCSDWYAPYPASPVVCDPQGPPARPPSACWKGQALPPGRVIRGGSYSYPVSYGRCGSRHFSFPGDRNVNLGFRVVTEAA
jgi:sulfatase modifying factor 1